jgi:general secretion pathway protein F/type IV pilus assembly protein PilC
MIYRYIGIDSNGKKIKDKIEASNINEAKSKLKANGIIYSSIKEEKSSLFEGISLKRRYSIHPKELSSLSRELAIYIKSGISIVQALKIVQGHYGNNKKVLLFLNAVSTLLDEGESFYSALSKQKIANLPEFYKQSIKVSEDGGILDEVLLELS